MKEIATQIQNSTKVLFESHLKDQLSELSMSKDSGTHSNYTNPFAEACFK